MNLVKKLSWGIFSSLVMQRGMPIPLRVQESLALSLAARWRYMRRCRAWRSTSGILSAPSIAAAIEEQATATRDIARNISEASVGVNDSNTRVSETSHVSREIAKDIGGVDQAAGELASGIDLVRDSAGSLSDVAEALRLTVSRFHA